MVMFNSYVSLPKGTLYIFASQLHELDTSWRCPPPHSWRYHRQSRASQCSSASRPSAIPCPGKLKPTGWGWLRSHKNGDLGMTILKVFKPSQLFQMIIIYYSQSDTKATSEVDSPVEKSPVIHRARHLHWGYPQWSAACERAKHDALHGMRGPQ